MNLEPNLESLVVVVVIAVVVLLVELEQAVSNVARVDGYLQVHNCIFNGTSGAGEVPVAIVGMFTGGGGAGGEGEVWWSGGCAAKLIQFSSIDFQAFDLHILIYIHHMSC